MGCGSGGRALVWGARDRGFESRHSNFQALKRLIFNRLRAFLAVKIMTLNDKTALIDIIKYDILSGLFLCLAIF